MDQVLHRYGFDWLPLLDAGKFELQKDARQMSANQKLQLLARYAKAFLAGGDAVLHGKTNLAEHVRARCDNPLSRLQTSKASRKRITEHYHFHLKSTAEYNVITLVSCCRNP